jgi:hypothetical protein
LSKALGIAALLCALTTFSLAGVTVSSPTSGSQVTSPVHFVASASGNYPITWMTVYSDGNGVYGIGSNHIDANISLGNGNHYIVVQAWDSKGNVYKAPGFQITVTGSGGDGGGGGSPTYTMIHAMSGWTTCDSCAGSGPTPHSMTQHIGNPSMTGNATQYWLGGGSPYHNALWWKQLGANPNATHFIYDLYFYMTNAGAAQALEFDMNQSVGGHKFIFGTQCNIRNGSQWDVWDTANGKWVHSGVGCSRPPAYTWNHVVLEFQRVGSQTKFISVTLNGNKSYFNRTFNTYGSGVSELNTAVQLDGDYNQEDYSMWVDKMQVTAW